MTSDFAKIVRAKDGAMVLFLKEQDDEGKPSVYSMTEYDGITAKLGIGFADDDTGVEAADRYYDSQGEEEAEAFRQRIIKLMTT